MYDEGRNRGGDRAALAARYREFGRGQVGDASPPHARLCKLIADSDVALDFLSSLPAPKQQPNLFLAALKLTGPLPDSPGALAGRIRGEAAALRAVMLARRTQTNEPGRCGALLPALAMLPGPLALIEVGASAGLCLIPDLYGYGFGGQVLNPDAPVRLAPKLSGPVPVPVAMPRIAWRRGLDLNPLDPRSASDRDWLAALVWPGQTDRLDRLRAALGLAAEARVSVEAGDLVRDLPAVLAQVPDGVTPVVFHTAVLVYVDPAGRDAFRAAVKDTGAHWISNEAPGVFADLAHGAPAPPAPDRFLMALDGVPLAWTGPHGQSLDWFGPVSFPLP